MLVVMTAIPPMPHRSMMTSGDVVAFGVTIGVLVAVVLLIMIILTIAGKRIERRQPQVKAAEGPDEEVGPEPRSSAQTWAQVLEEETLLLPR